MSEKRAFSKRISDEKRVIKLRKEAEKLMPIFLSGNYASVMILLRRIIWIRNLLVTVLGPFLFLGNYPRDGFLFLLLKLKMPGWWNRQTPES